MDNAITGYGSTVAGAITGTIGNINNVTWSGVDGEDIEFKTLADVNRFINTIAGSQRPGSMTIVCIYDKTQFATLIGRTNQANENWTVTLGDGTTIVCAGHIKTVSGLNPNPDSEIQYTVDIPLSGEPAVTPG